MSDLISRQAANKALDSHRYVYANKHLNDYEQGWNDAIDYAVDEWIDDLPSAEPKRPSGKWLSHDDYCKKHGYIPSGLIAFWWCDQCEQGVDYSTNFCPNCGADMRGEEE